MLRIMTLHNQGEKNHYVKYMKKSEYSKMNEQKQSGSE